MPSLTRSVRELDKPDHPIYGEQELEYFMQIMHEALEELRAQQSPLVRPEQENATRTRIAAAIFKHADSGVRDAAVLRRRALDALK